MLLIKSSGNCCKEITIESNGPSAEVQFRVFGEYTFLNQSNGRIVYKNNMQDGYFLYSKGSSWTVSVCMKIRLIENI